MLMPPGYEYLNSHFSETELVTKMAVMVAIVSKDVNQLYTALSNLERNKSISIITELSYANRELYQSLCKDTYFFEDEELNQNLKLLNYQIKLKKFDRCNEILKKYSATNTHGATALYLRLYGSCSEL
jgi:hypothetical protein